MRTGQWPGNVARRRQGAGAWGHRGRRLHQESAPLRSGARTAKLTLLWILSRTAEDPGLAPLGTHVGTRGPVDPQET